MLVLVGCAARTLRLPADPGTPFPDAPAIHASLARACGGVKTLQAELGLSGHAGAQKLRGRVIAAFAAPDSMRLEGVAPFGAPAFILVSRAGTATLLLRDNSVLRSAKVEDILGAMTGVSLSAADLLAVLTGCVVPSPAADGGMLHANGWASIRLKGNASLYLQRKNTDWQLRAATLPRWQIEYVSWAGSFPSAVRLKSANGGAGQAGRAGGTVVDLTASISQLETNASLPPEAFSVMVPANARPITLDDLRDAGPLRGAGE